MNFRFVLFLSVAATLCAANAFAQTDSGQQLIAPDRPGFTNSSNTVAPGRVILESGFARTRDRDANGAGTTDDFPEALLRFGVTPKLELQLGLPNYNSAHGGPSGFGDAFVGAKIKVYQRGETRASLAPGVSVPFGRRDLRSSNFLPTLLFGVDTAFGERTKISANLILSETQQSGGAGASSGGSGSSSNEGGNTTRNEFTVAPAASVGYNLTPKLGAFVDAYAIVPRHGASTAVADGGLTYLLTNDVQLDLEYGHGLGGGASPNHFYGGGVAVRF